MENLIKVFQGCLVQSFWKGLEVHGKSTKGRNDWKGRIEVLKVVIILTEVLIQVKGEGLPKTRWGNRKDGSQSGRADGRRLKRRTA